MSTTSHGVQAQTARPDPAGNGPSQTPVTVSGAPTPVPAVPGDPAPAVRAVPPPPGARAVGILLLRVVGILIVLALLTGGAVSLAFQFFSQKRSETSTVAEPVTKVVARTDTGNIRIRAGAPGSPVKVGRELNWTFGQAHVSVEVHAGVLNVTGACEGAFRRCSTDLEITLPAGTPVEVTTGVGDIRATGMSGRIVTETSVGDIYLSAIEAPTVQATTRVGDVDLLGGLPGARVRARTNTGDIRLRLDAPPDDARAVAGQGNIRIVVPAGDSYSIDTDAHLGDVRVQVPRDSSAPRHLYADTNTGDIRIGIDSSVGEE